GGPDDPLVDASLFRGLKQRERVLRETAAAIARPRVQELGPDAVIKSNAAGDVLDVSVDGLAQVRDFVDEADLHRKERIGRILRELGGAAASNQDRRTVEDRKSVV